MEGEECDDRNLQGIGPRAGGRAKAESGWRRAGRPCGDALALIDRDPNHVAVPDITRLYVSKRYSPAEVEAVHRATRVEALPESWRTYFLGRLEKLG